MSILKKALAAVATVAVAGSMAVATATPAAADWYEDGVFSLRYTDSIWRVDSASDSAWPLTYEEWQALGFPTPKPAQTDYVKYPWSPTVYAVTFFGNERDEWHWEAITFEQWSRAGYPSPRNAGWIEGSEYFQWGTSSELFVWTPADDVVHKLTYSQWQASGFMPAERIANEGFVKVSGNANIYYSDDLGARSAYGPLTYEDWRYWDFPTPLVVNW
ncbi:hypothetical protein L1785_05275 [Antribacter sp. KLBMP9083]|uniref:Uncharacterized protein n=1 Tax=Antribacter soli TaxID=2910976 RepID=A0AA41QDZ7_9MICO|nr:hypothetical protein [Antribacter soli]MCF4120384.1 hypothetical protein [Antribacter soli]